MKKIIFIALLLLISGDNLFKAQVTIGSLDVPKTGVLLDLNSSGKRGALVLSNVYISDIQLIPTDNPKIFPGITSSNNDHNANFTGAIVYNTNSQLAEGVGVYVWDGEQWNSLCVAI